MESPENLRWAVRLQHFQLRGRQTTKARRHQQKCPQARLADINAYRSAADHYPQDWNVAPQAKLAEAELKIQQLEKNAAGELKLKPIETAIEA